MPNTEVLALARICDDAWLAESLGYPVYRLECDPDALPRDEEEDALAKMVEQHGSLFPRALYYAKVSCLANAMLQHLQVAKFRVVDVNIRLSQPGGVSNLQARDSAHGNVADTDVVIRTAEASDEEPLARIAGSCFRYSRFHRDPLVDNAAADQIKQRWVMSAFRGDRGDRLWVAVREGEVVGFLSSRTDAIDADARATIDLVGVDRACQRRGVGAALARQFLSYYRDDCAELLVGTQAANIPSLRLYQRSGFEISDSSYVLHRHIK